VTAEIAIRKAGYDDIPAILALLMDDDLGKLRETVDIETYAAAFRAIEDDPNQLLAVGETRGAVIACLQITFIPGLSRKGMWRGHVEAVRVARHLRGQGIGTRMMRWAIACCRERKCGLVQLTSDERRPEAHRFYEALGFTGSHRGFKLAL
jgi:GNAT superfamily N-acetyltransferase